MSLSAELGLDVPITDLRHEAMLNIVHTANWLASAGTPLFRRFGLTNAQFNALFSLKYKNMEITQSDLGKRLVVSRASITSVLDKLQEKGLVQRKSVRGNRRIYHVSLTPRGHRLIDEVEPLYRERVHDAVSDLSDAECRSLIAFLEQVRARTRASLSGVELEDPAE